MHPHIFTRYARALIVGTVIIFSLYTFSRSSSFSLDSFLIDNSASRQSTLPAKLQFDFPKETIADSKIRKERQETVRDAFIHSYVGYQSHAWLHDEVKPVSGNASDPFCGWGATMIDMLDTVWLMGLKHEFESAVRAVSKINFRKPNKARISTFEVNIRYLGGLLGAYDMSSQMYPMLLLKARELGDFLMGALSDPSGLPMTDYDWDPANKPKPSTRPTFLAEVGSLSLEFLRLSQLTGDRKYYSAITKIDTMLENVQHKTRIPGLWPAVIDRELTFQGDMFTWGALADSTYEYLPKQYMLLVGKTDKHLKMYEKAFETAKKYLFVRPMIPDKDRDILFSIVANVKGTTQVHQDPTVQHLSCFVGGMVAIGAKLLRREEEMKTAEMLTDGCVWAYEQTRTGIMPELFSVLTCPDQNKCDWDQALYDNKTNPVDSTGIARDTAIREKLPLGFTAIQDPRYLLR
jgi:mannosyl-oligosaccharide alpha-1,2-mannosidase